MPKAQPVKLKLMVSSTVYHVVEQLDQIYATLEGFGYEVWMSHKGTLPVFSNVSAFANCLAAVEHCDLFLGIITPFYGSGIDGTNLSIFHQEVDRAVTLNKPRWFLAHHDVVFLPVKFSSNIEANRVLHSTRPLLWMTFA